MHITYLLFRAAAFVEKEKYAVPLLGKTIQPACHSSSSARNKEYTCTIRLSHFTLPGSQRCIITGCGGWQCSNRAHIRTQTLSLPTSSFQSSLLTSLT